MSAYEVYVTINMRYTLLHRLPRYSVY